MSDFKLTRFRFKISLLKDGSLPPYKGSTLRGAMGYGLKENACKNPEGFCSDCNYVRFCTYIKLFKPDYSPGKSIPAPYIIDPPPLKKTFFLSGSLLSFTLTLFGWSSAYIPTYIDALKIAGEKYGLGSERIPFKLQEVSFLPYEKSPVQVYREDGYTGSKIKSITFSAIKKRVSVRNDASVQVRILTPMKLKQNGHFRADLSPQIFLESLVRRLKGLARFYHTDDFVMDSKIGDFKNIEMNNSNLRWIVLERYSTNHPASINLGGLVGGFVFKNVSPQLFSLLRLGELVHIGKNTVYGCGKFRLE